MSDSGQKFYAVSTMPPPWSVKVWVLWPYKRGLCGPFLCMRHRDNGREGWVTFDKGARIDLPPKSKTPADPARPYIGYHNLEDDRPLYWAPQKPELWKMPLPAVAYVWRDPATVASNYSSQKQEFSAADLAAEMEADRDATNRETNVSRENRQGRVAEQWWRDASKINFDQSPQELTKRDCEGRLMRAIALSGAREMASDLTMMTSDALSMIAEAAGDASKYPTCDLAMRLMPDPREGGERFLEAMRWFASLGDRPWRPVINDYRTTWAFSEQQDILVKRALPIPYSYDEIGDPLGVSGDTVKKRYAKAIDWAWQVGAGLVSTWIDAEIAELRERNRAWKRNHQGAIL